MKKYLLSLLVCILAIPVMLCGCSAGPLANAPTATAPNKNMGSALGYTEYIYFANAFQPSAEMEEGYDKDNTALYRIKNQKTIETDEETGLPTGQEKVLAKVIGSEYTFMYSSGSYIYFASPSQEINPETHGEHFYNYNQYYRIQTDGTGLTKFYSTKSTISQQTILKINGKEYLVLVDNSKLVKIELGKTISQPITLAEDFESVIFANQYITNGDNIAYYLTNLPEGDEYIGKQGNLIYGVDIVTGEPLYKNSDDEPKALNDNQPRTMTLKKVFDGKLYFTIKQIVGNTEQDEVYAYLSQNFNYTVISTALTNITTFDVVKDENGYNYHIFAGTNGLYSLPNGTENLNNNQILAQEINLLFISGDYIYFTYKSGDKGIYRISVQNKQVETINNLEDVKTTNIAFDGKYIYFYALNTDNTTGTYYMHRSRVDINQANAELLSVVLDEDKPTVEEE